MKTKSLPKKRRPRSDSLPGWLLNVQKPRLGGSDICSDFESVLTRLFEQIRAAHSGGGGGGGEQGGQLPRQEN